MKKYLLLLTALTCAFTATRFGRAADTIHVATSTLDMADFARNVGGERVEVYPITVGRGDLHFFEPLPSQVVKLREADLLVIGGLDLDIWIRPMMEASRNPRIQWGAKGFVDPSDGVKTIQKPKLLDYLFGADVHPHGNPHFWFTPGNVRIAVNNICEGLCRVDHAGAAYYRKKKDSYLREVDATFKELQAKMAPHRGAGIVQYHASWDYFCNAFGLRVIGTLEPKPGIPPSPFSIARLVKTMRRENCSLIIAEPYYPGKPVTTVAERTGASVLRLPIYLGGQEGVDSYLDHLRLNVETITKALHNATER